MELHLQAVHFTIGKQNKPSSQPSALSNLQKEIGFSYKDLKMPTLWQNSHQEET